MSSTNKRKNELLGMPYGTASGKLRKMLMFSMAQKLNMDVCFRCGEIIENIDNLSIEHKNSWERSDNPIETFFDLDNVVFSHLICNIKAAYRRVPVGVKSNTPHGITRYDKYGCRCSICKEAKAIKNKKRYS